jgi:hypothetical protein
MVCWYVRYKRPWAYYINYVLWSNVCVIRGFGSIGFVTLMQPFPIGSVTTRWTLLVGVGHSRLDSIVPLMLRAVCCAMAGALALYYRSLKIVSTLLRIGNISGRPCVGVMTYKALDFFALKTIRQSSSSSVP